MTWHCSPNPYAYKNYNLPEAQDNATEIRNWLASFGWTDNAICGFLGNVHTEGAYNPWCWERQGQQGGPKYDPPTYAYWQQTYNDARGYGLVQFTPAAKYIDGRNYWIAHGDDSRAWSPEYPPPPDVTNFTGYGPYFADVPGSQYDGIAQLYFINYYADYYDNIPGAIPNFPYSQYKASTDSVAYLTEVWIRNYERPSEAQIEQSLPERIDAAEFWWTFFTGTPPEPPTPPGPEPGPIITKKRKIVILAGGKWYIRC